MLFEKIGELAGKLFVWSLEKIGIKTFKKENKKNNNSKRKSNKQ